MSTWLGLSGVRVLVAGAGGLGSAIAHGFLEAGADVTLVDRDGARLQELAQVCGFDPASERTMVADLTEAGVADEVVRKIVERRGGIDIMVHCIGVNDRRPLLEFSDSEWDDIFRLNLGTAFRLGRAVGKQMVADGGGGRMVFLSSVAGVIAHRDHGPYAAAKAAMNQMVRAMAVEWSSYGVGVNAVAPGYTETGLTAAHLAQPGVQEALVNLIPAGHLGTPKDVVGPVLFLSSQQSGFINGQVIYVDGGRTLV